VFGRLAIQSPAYWVSEDPDWWTGPSLFDMVDAAPDSLFTIYMSTGTINDAEEEARRMRDLFLAHGHALTYREVPEGHSWGNWRALIDEVLMALVPGPNATSADPPTEDTGLRLDGFPNPAVGRATLRFTLPASAEVSLACYDGLGRLCATLADGPLAAGTYERAFPERGLQAGRYLCRLRTARGAATRVVTLAAR
jgi:enterochelin esterase family protein